MKNLIKIFLLMLVSLTLSTELFAEKIKNEKDFNETTLTPDNMPTEVILVETQPVLLLTIHASDSGYEVESNETKSVPTMSIFLSRDVYIAGLNSENKVVTALSVFNPRDVRPVGSKEKEIISTLPEATFTVALPSPEQIEKIHIVVRRGANKGLDTFIPVNKKNTQQYTEDSHGKQLLF